MTVRFQSDWLGTQPCFYHERSGAVSTRIHDVIDYRNLEFDGEGLTDYLEMGYCAFGHTPVRHVRILPPCTQLTESAHGTLREVSLPDPVDAWAGRVSQPAQALERLRQEITRWEQTCDQQVILPLSGGYDSRLLAALSSIPKQLRAFTYGVSKNQPDSRECRRAQAVATKLGIPWEQIELQDFHTRVPAWERQFGISTHAHGMYHLEFYAKIATRFGTGLPLLSGLVGDAWAGSIPLLPAASAADLPGLGLSRGINAGGLLPRFKTDYSYRSAFWAARKERFKDPVFQIVEVIRQKMVLLAFALIVPRQMGFVPWCPFLVPEVALTMVTLPPALRFRRRWQSELFTKNGIDVEKTAGGSKENNLDLHMLHLAPPEPLDVDVLSELFAREDVVRVNRLLFSPGALARQRALAGGYPFFAKIFGRLRLPNPHFDAYGTYMTLKPLEALIRRRNSA